MSTRAQSVPCIRDLPDALLRRTQGHPKEYEGFLESSRSQFPLSQSVSTMDSRRFCRYQPLPVAHAVSEVRRSC